MGRCISVVDNGELASPGMQVLCEAPGSACFGVGPGVDPGREVKLERHSEASVPPAGLSPLHLDAIHPRPARPLSELCEEQL